MTGNPAEKRLRAAGDTARQLAESVRSMELDESDQVLIDAAMGLAVKLDTVTSEALEVRYHAHFLRAVSSLSKKSDENRARRLADEKAQREAAAKVRARENDPIAQLRIRRRQDDAEREKYEKRMTAKIRRMARQGMSVDEIAEKIQYAPHLVKDYLKEDT